MRKSLNSVASRRGNRGNRCRGFTLIELMVVVAIAGLLATLAAPSFVKITQQYRAMGEVSAFVGDLQFARNEAIKEGIAVSLCASANATSSPPSCSGSNSWQTGWIVFSNASGTGTYSASTDTVLRIQKTWTNTDSFVADNALSALTFSREGFARNLPGLVTFVLHTTPSNTQATRCVAVNLAGRQQVQTVGQGNCT